MDKEEDGERVVTWHLPPKDLWGFFSIDLSHEVETTTVELAQLGKLEKLQECRDASSVPFGRNICVSNHLYGGLIRGRSPVGWEY